MSAGARGVSGWMSRVNAWIHGSFAALRREGFARNVSRLAAGTLGAQLIGIFSNPLISRMYGPAACGDLATFTSVAAMIGPAVCLRYEFALLLSNQPAGRRNLVNICVLLIAIATALTCAVLGLGTTFQWLGDFGRIGNAIWVLPASLALTGLNSVAGMLATAKAAFGRLARIRAFQSMLAAGSVLGSGYLLGAHSSLLILGTQLSPIVTLLWLSFSLKEEAKAVLRPVPTWAELRPLLAEHRQFPYFNMPMTLIDQVTAGIPMLLFFERYGKEAAGWFGLSVMLVRVPVNLLGASVAQVFFQQAGTLGQNMAALRRLTLKSVPPLILSAVALIVGAWTLGKPAVTWIYGPAWAPAGDLLRLVALSGAAVIVTSPISTLPTVLGKQRGHFALAAFGSSIRVVAVYAGVHWGTLFDAVSALVTAECFNALIFLTWMSRLLSPRIQSSPS